ncbi:MAG TPA: outer membrane beta-barrel domain-containing protein [Burkholderiales bacterium]
MTNLPIPAFLIFTLSLIVPATATAQSATESIPEPVIPAQVDRRNVHIPKIRANDIEVGAFTGILSVQDFGAKPASGLRLGYHVTEDFFVEGMYGRSKVSDQSFRRFGAAIFKSEEIPLTYYSLSVGWDLFPGEVFVGKNWAMTSAVYLVGGVGNVNFNSEDHTTYNFGIGIRVLPADWFSMRFEIRDLMFNSDLLGKNELKQNFEMTLGIAAYF